MHPTVPGGLGRRAASRPDADHPRSPIAACLRLGPGSSVLLVAYRDPAFSDGSNLSSALSRWAIHVAAGRVLTLQEVPATRLAPGTLAQAEQP